MSASPFIKARSRMVAPSVVVDADTYAISSVTVGGRTWECAETPCFQIRTWTSPSEMFDFTTLDSGDFDVDVDVDSDGVTTITGTKTHGGGVITFVGAITPDTENQKLSFSCTVTSTMTTVAVAIVEFPRFAPIPRNSPSDIYAFFPTGEGYVRRSPHLATTEIAMSMPAAMQFFSLYDGVTGSQLYLERRYVDDDIRPFAALFLEGGESGDADSTTISFGHIPKDGRTAGADYDQSDWYTLTLEAVEAKGDKRTAFIDACEKYSEWALEMAGDVPRRPWVPDDKWFDASSDVYSTRVAGARVWTRIDDIAVSNNTTTPDYSYIRTELQRTKGNLGAASNTILMAPGLWHRNRFDYDLPSHTPQRGATSFNTHISNIHTDSEYVVAYVNPELWIDDLNVSGYIISAYTDYLGDAVGDIRTGMLKEIDGTTLLTTVGVDGDWATLDYSYWTAWDGYSASGYTFTATSTTTTLVDADLIKKYVDDAAGVDALYVDIIGGSSTFIRQNFNTSGPFGGGNHGRYVTGKQITWTFINQVGKAISADLGFITEQPDENLLRGMEASNFYDIALSGYNYGTSCAAFRRVYGDYHRAYSFSPQIVDNSFDLANPYLQNCFVNWLRTGMISFIEDLSPAATNMFSSTTDYTDPLTDLGGFAFGARAMYSLLTYAEDYIVKGKLLRPTRISFELDAIDADTDLSSFSQDNILVVADDEKCPHAVFKHKTDETWAIIAMNQFASAADFRIVFDSRDYGMPAGTKNLYRTVAGVRTLLTTFKHRIDYSTTVPLATMGMFEIVPA